MKIPLVGSPLLFLVISPTKAVGRIFLKHFVKFMRQNCFCLLLIMHPYITLLLFVASMPRGLKSMESPQVCKP